MRQLAIAIALLWSTTGGSAAAQSAVDKATAQALFDAAKQLLKDGNYNEACPKLAESQRLDPAPGTLLNLADCYEKSGMTASAWATWLEAAAACHSAGQGSRERVAREHAATLKAQLPNITIAVPEASRLTGLILQRDGAPVGAATWGTPMPVDPGNHVIVATAPGHRNWQTNVTIVAGTKPIVITIPALELEGGTLPAASPTNIAPAVALTPVTANAATAGPAIPPSAPAAKPEGSASPASPPASPPAAQSTPPTVAEVPPAAASSGTPQATARRAVGSSTVGRDGGAGGGSVQRTFGYVVMGAGALGLGLGTVFGLEAKSKNDDSLAQCRTPTNCGPRGYDLRQQALDAASKSTVLFGIGSAALVTGIVLLVTAPSTASVPKQASWSLGPSWTKSAAGVTVQGAF